MRETRDRDELKGRVKKWMGVGNVEKVRDALDMTIMETFFHIYARLERGENIQEIGNDLGVFPLP